MNLLLIYFWRKSYRSFLSFLYKTSSMFKNQEKATVLTAIQDCNTMILHTDNNNNTSDCYITVFSFFSVWF